MKFPPLAGRLARPAAGGVGRVPERAGAGSGGRRRSCRAAAAGAGVGRRAARGRGCRRGGGQAQKPQVDPEVRQQATDKVQEVLATLEAEIGEGHGKASAGAAAPAQCAQGARQADQTTAWRTRPMPRWLPPASSKAGSAGAPTSCARNWWPSAEGLLKRPRARPSAGARCRRTCARCASSGSRPTRAVCRTTPCGSASTRPATRPTRWSRPGSRRSSTEAAEHRAQRLALIEEVKAWAAANTTALRRRLARLQPHPAPVRRPLARCRPCRREDVCRTAAAVEGGDQPGRGSAGGPAEAQHQRARP
jgi:hypothetical protein